MEKREEHYPNYFVQSPSSVYHDPESEFQAPTRTDSVPLVLARVNEYPRYSYFLENNFLYEDDEKRLMPLRSSNSGWWIVLQIGWRFLFSFGVALLVFFIATQPPHPNISLRIGRFNQFILEEGVDSHGASTKFLSCNCSAKLIVDNKSNVFGLHIHPPSIKLFFGPLNFAKAQGPKLYALSDESTTFQLYIGTKNRAMYGAGREMEDMLKSRAGLPLILRMSLISDFRVVWSIINPKYHHKVECLLLLADDERHNQVTMKQLRRRKSMTEAGDDLTTVPTSVIKPIPFLVIFKDLRHVFSMDAIGREILGMAFPAALALAADPIASLIDTAFIGRLGAVQVAAVGVSIAIFNQASRITIFPLVSITTSFVAEEDTMEKLKEEANKANLVHAETILVQDSLEKGISTPTSNNTIQPQQPPASDTKSNSGNKTNKKGKRTIRTASTAMILGLILGLVQAIILIFSSKVLLGVMGVKPNSAMLSPAHKYLTIRALGTPALLLSLAMQGIFRGFKDTKTPLFATVTADIINIVLDPIFIFVLRLGISGAAIAHVISQYFMTLILFIRLAKKVNLMPPNFGDLQFGRFLKNGILLLARTIAVTFCQTLAAAMAARLGTTPMAAFQICLQVWLTSSLLNDGLAVAGQAILACSFAEKDYNKVTATTSRILQMGFVLGVGLSVFVGMGLYFGSGIFTKDPSVIHLVAIGIPFVAATQPINSLAFVLDGVNFGASDFAYTAYSMVGVAAISIVAIIYMAKTNGFIGIWIALTIYMGLRAITGIARMGTGTGPWKFLRGRSSSSS